MDSEPSQPSPQNQNVGARVIPETGGPQIPASNARTYPSQTLAGAAHPKLRSAREVMIEQPRFR
jgi:hypothetical protein